MGHSPAKCPPEDGTAGAWGNGDGDAGATDDFHYDINGAAAGNNIVAPNGELEQWCIDGKYFVIVWKDANGARHFVGKCLFVGGKNAPNTYSPDAATGNIEGTEWTSTDNGKGTGPPDDDRNNKFDSWTYRYSTGTNNLDQEHREDGAVQGDGTSGASPADLGDLLPKTSTNDNPTVAGCPLFVFRGGTRGRSDAVRVGDLPPRGLALLLAGTVGFVRRRSR